VQLVIAAIRAKRSILLSQKSVYGQGRSRSRGNGACFECIVFALNAAHFEI
jgi:hypothetical protein